MSILAQHLQEGNSERNTDRVRVLAFARATGCKDTRRVELRIHRRSLTRVNHKEDLLVPATSEHQLSYYGDSNSDAADSTPLLSMHLLECISYVVCRYFFLILKFEKFVSPMPGHVNENI